MPLLTRLTAAAIPILIAVAAIFIAQLELVSYFSWLTVLAVGHRYGTDDSTLS